MALLSLYTLRVIAGGSITCRNCSMRVDLLEPVSLMLWDARMDHTLHEDNSGWISALGVDGGILHRCGRELEWWCGHCRKVVPEPDAFTQKLGTAAKKAALRHWDSIVVCQTCRQPITQRASPDPHPGRET